MSTEPGLLTIREAVEADLPAILEIYAQPELGDAIVFSLEEAKRHLRELKERYGYRLYAAELEGKVVGTFSFFVLHTLGRRGAPCAVVEDLAVHRDSHGRGVGRGMLDHVRKLAKGEGCHKISISSNAQRSAPEGAYSSLGFEREGYTLVMKP